MKKGEKKIKTWKCDVCGKDKPRKEIVRLRRQDLIEDKKVPGTFGKVSIRKGWIKDEFKKLEETNPNFSRLSKICIGCLK